MKLREFPIVGGIARLQISKDNGVASGFASHQTNNSHGQTTLGPWQSCCETGCYGQIFDNDRCVAHQKIEQFRKIIASSIQENKSISINGSFLRNEYIETIVSLLNQNTDIGLQLSLFCCQIEGRPHIHSAIAQNLSFSYCDIPRGISIKYSQIGRISLFMTCLDDSATFDNISVEEKLDLRCCHISQNFLQFRDCSFGQGIDLSSANGHFVLENCKLAGGVSVNESIGSISVKKTDIAGDFYCRESKFRHFRLSEVVFSDCPDIGEFHVETNCEIERVVFKSRIQIQVNANELILTGTRLADGGRILANVRTLCLNGFSADRPVHILGIPWGAQRPVLVAAQNADLGNVSFAGIDVGRCVLTGTQGISSTKFESSVTFADAPNCLLISRRKVIADEYLLRRKRNGFFLLFWETSGPREITDGRSIDRPSVSELLPTCGPSEVAAAYRQLRKSFEGVGNYPGGSDAYFGEMEMRRMSEEAQIGERVLLYLYWITSGYGLRASRALIWFWLIVIGGALLSDIHGFSNEPSEAGASIVFALRSVLPGIRPEGQLTLFGRYLEIFLSFFGPVFLGLALLAVRGRLKR